MSLSWSEAFKSGFMACIFQCVWGIIGSIVIFVGVIVGGADLLNGGVNALGTSFLIVMVFYIIGLFIILFGAFASIIKVSVDTSRGK